MSDRLTLAQAARLLRREVDAWKETRKSSDQARSTFTYGEAIHDFLAWLGEPDPWDNELDRMALDSKERW